MAYPGALPIHGGSCTYVIQAIANVEGIIVCPRVKLIRHIYICHIIFCTLDETIQ